MKKLKSIFRCNGFVIFIIFFTFLYCRIIFFHEDPPVEVAQTEFIGIIEAINKKEDKIQLQLKGTTGNILLANNYITEEDQDSWLSQIKIGYKVKIIGSLRTPSKNTNFNMFNYRYYLLSKGISYVMTVDKIEVLSSKQNLLYSLKDKIGERIDKNFRSDYLRAFLLGDTDFINEIVMESYRINGISHLFSVSGMHVGFISSFILIILGKFIKRESWKKLILYFLLFFYAFLAGFSPSILRSVLFMVLLFIKEKINLPYSTFQLFLVMTCGFLLYNPYYICNTGFLYSFIISGFLIYFGSLLRKKQYLKQLFLVSFIAFLGSFPLTLVVNFEINFLSPFLNLLFVPLVSFFIFPLSFVVFIFPFVTPLYDVGIMILEKISLWCINNFSFLVILGKPHFLLIVFYYGISIFIIENLKKKLGYIVLIIVLFFQYHSRILLFYPRLTIIDVGQGDCLLLEFPFHQKNILVDTGGIIGKSYSLGTSVIIPYLKSLGIKKLNYLILSHGDFDHMGEAINLVNNFKVENVIFNCGEFNELERELIKDLEEKNIKYYSCIKQLNIGDNKLYFLNNKDYGNENDNSIVIYIQLNNYKFLFMGDAGVKVEEDLIEKYNLQNINVLKIGHHGSKTSSSKEFIDKIKPTYSIISVGKNNRYDHPNEQVLNILDDSKIYRTDQDGSIMLKIKNNKLKIETCIP